jgi:hypothetical protein
VAKLWAAFGVVAGELVDAGELRGGREGGARGQKGMLLGCVVISRSRGGVYIGAREVGRDVAGMVAMSPGASCAGFSGPFHGVSREVGGSGGRVHSGGVAGVVYRAREDEADVGILASWRRPGMREGQRPCLSGEWERVECGGAVGAAGLQCARRGRVMSSGW